jgi:amidophosphoribosyltransferase
VTGARDECGVFAAVGHPRAAQVVYQGLHALQHRGQESAGIASAGPGGLSLHRGLGLLAQAFDQVDPSSLVGEWAIGHVRYSTQGSPTLDNAQPLSVTWDGGYAAACQNGNVTNALSLRRELEAKGVRFHSTVDTEVLLALLARSPGDNPQDQARKALERLEGGYAFLVLLPQGVVAARDPYGIRPLVLGEGQGTWYAASETCALDYVGARYVREVDPGEVVWLTPLGPRTLGRRTPGTAHLCVFEAVYLARPDSHMPGGVVHAMRKEAGRRLAQEAPAKADLVTGVPDSGVSAALGYAQESGLPYELGLLRHRYVPRTFLEPTPGQREGGVRRKLTAVRGVVAGKRVVVVDDSVVRGTTSRHIVQLLREAGAREVHLRVASPPVRHPCFFGIDMGDPEELLAHRLSLEGMRRFVGADSLAFLSLEGLLAASGATGEGDGGYCTACFSGRYAAPLPQTWGKFALEGRALGRTAT